MQAAYYEDHSIPHSLKAHILFDLPVSGLIFLMTFTLAQHDFAVNDFLKGLRFKDDMPIIAHEINEVEHERRKLMNCLGEKIKKLLPRKQMSEAFVNCVFLALSGGFQDAYTYVARDQVFSNAQTGNVVLMSQRFMLGEWMEGMRYLFPLLAFALGVFFTERIQGRFRMAQRLHWRQVVLLMEIGILFAVGFLPDTLNMAATVLVSFSCAMQVQAFRKVDGYSYASTMCIGNLRSGTASLSVYFREKKPEQLRQALYYFGIIFFFAVGAGFGGILSARYGAPTIWVSGGLLLISFALMSLEKLKE